MINITSDINYLLFCNKAFPDLTLCCQVGLLVSPHQNNLYLFEHNQTFLGNVSYLSGIQFWICSLLLQHYSHSIGVELFRIHKSCFLGYTFLWIPLHHIQLLFLCNSWTLGKILHLLHKKNYKEERKLGYLKKEHDFLRSTRYVETIVIYLMIELSLFLIRVVHWVKGQLKKIFESRLYLSNVVEILFFSECSIRICLQNETCFATYFLHTLIEAKCI